MAQLGYYSLIIGAVFSVYTFIITLLGIKNKSRSLVDSGKNGIVVTFIFLSLASFVMLYALLTRDFSIEYVYQNTSRSLSLLYTISAFWAGQKGSLLFWAWLLTLFNTIVVLDKSKTKIVFFPIVVVILASIQMFFLILLIVVSDPFTKLNFLPFDGYGLNPLLQNPGMTWHPPTLFIGYVGYTIPFAFAIAALISKKLDSEWIKAIRRWNIFSWFFLGIGILLGAQWAYVELGWGGYWAWDPIENASFMPWLVGTAFLHSAMIQEKRDMLKVWNMVLIILTFTLCVFGTFLTRSGVLSSVHAFGETGLGPYLLSFITFTLVGSIWLVIARKDHLKSKNDMESLLSKESMFLLNNFIFFSLAFVTLWGTTFPMFSELIKGEKLTVGPAFFNKVNVPIGIALLILMGICPLIAWNKTSWTNFKKNFLFPTTIGGISLISLLIIGVIKPMALISFVFVFFVLAAIGLEFYRGTLTRRKNSGKNYFSSFFGLIGNNKRRYGGYIVHVGIMFMYLGMAGIGAYSYEKTITAEIGETFTIKDYTITYDDFQYYPTSSKEIVRAVLTVYKNGKPLCRLTPEKNFHPQKEQPTTEVAIASTLKEDLYVILGGYNEYGLASFRIFINPLVLWMWIGGIVSSLGFIIAFWPNRKRAVKAKTQITVSNKPDEGNKTNES